MQRLDGEDLTGWEIRCCLAKKRGNTDMDWAEIRDMLGLEITPDQLRKQAVGYEKYDNYIHGYGGVGKRILSLSDFHIPFNLPLETFAEYSGLIDTLVLNGDIEDAQNVSKFSKKYRIHFTEEMITTRQYMIDLIKMINPKEVIIVKGNHEVRMGRYLSDQLNDDIMNLMPDSPMDLIINDGFKNRDRLNRTETWYSPLTEVFDGTGIDISYTGEWWRKVGKTIFVHPLSYSSGMLKTTEKAVEYFLRIDRDFDTICMSHTHKLGSFIQGGIHMYEQGCCCKTELLDYNDGYMTLPAQKGFIYICQDIEGNIMPNKTELITL